jgi:hypothetical protein
MKRLVLLLLVLSACLHRGPEDQPDPSEDEIPTDPYLITLLIHNRSGYMISAGGAGRVFGNVLPGEQKCVRLPNNDVQQQLWYRVMATESEQYTLPFYPRESSGWKWTIAGIGSPEHAVARANAADLAHWSQCH